MEILDEELEQKKTDLPYASAQRLQKKQQNGDRQGM